MPHILWIAILLTLLFTVDEAVAAEPSEADVQCLAGNIYGFWLSVLLVM